MTNLWASIAALAKRVAVTEARLGPPANNGNGGGQVLIQMPATLTSPVTFVLQGGSTVTLVSATAANISR